MILTVMNVAQRLGFLICSLERHRQPKQAHRMTEAKEHVRGYVGSSRSIFSPTGFALGFFDIRVPTLTVSGSSVNLDTVTPNDV